MLLKDFYYIAKTESDTPAQLVTDIVLNQEHPVFLGHFPGNPVTPGVCMMQIIKELTEIHISRPLWISQAKDVKFTALINPFIHPGLRLVTDILAHTATEVKVRNSTFMGEVLALKCTLNFTVR